MSRPACRRISPFGRAHVGVHETFGKSLAEKHPTRPPPLSLRRASSSQIQAFLLIELRKFENTQVWKRTPANQVRGFRVLTHTHFAEQIQPKPLGSSQAAKANGKAKVKPGGMAQSSSSNKLWEWQVGKELGIPLGEPSSTELDIPVDPRYLNSTVRTTGVCLALRNRTPCSCSPHQC